MPPVTVIAPALDLHLAGTVTALSPIQHGDGTMGTTNLVRTMRVVQPDGSTVRVPLVSGNGVRGRLRRVSADLLWRQLGMPLLSSEVFATIHSGGALTKMSSRINAAKVRQIRDTIPHLSLWGWAGGTRILEGRLRVANMLLACAETAHLTEIDGPSMWEQLDVASFSRLEERPRSHASTDQIAPSAGPRGVNADGEIVDTLEALADLAVEPFDDAPHDTQQMRFSTQVIAAGATLQWAIAAHRPSAVEAAWLRCVLTDWVADGATVGGRSSAGMGRLRLDFGGWQATDDDVALATAHHAKHGARIVEMLEWAV